MKIRGPIKLKCLIPIASSREEFCQRINGNYQMMTAAVTGEVLLHVMLAPAEFHIEEGGMTGIVNQNSQIQENQTWIINNLLNRILVSGHGTLTYQDKVFITGILNKLGIRDERRFMEEVWKLQQEVENTDELLELYLNHTYELRMLVKQYYGSHRKEKKSEMPGQDHRNLYLHEDIMNRLQTMAIYQYLQSLYHSETNTEMIASAELNMAMQTRLARKILLQQLKNEVRGEQLLLTYRHENYYEHREWLESNLTEEQIMSRMTSAVLLNLLDSVYESHISQSHKTDNWYRILGQPLYEIAKNSYDRLYGQTVIMQGRSDFAKHYLELSNQYDRQEISILNSLLSCSESVIGSEMQKLLRHDTVLREALYKRDSVIYEEAVRLEEILDRLLLKDYRTMEENEEELLQLHTALQEQLRISEHEGYGREVTKRMVEKLEHLISGHTKLQAYETRTAHGETDTKTVLSQRDIFWESEGTAGTYGQEMILDEGIRLERMEADAENDMEILKQRLAEIDRQNVNNQTLYQVLIKNLMQRPNRREAREGKLRMRQESLVALSDPEELLLSYRQEAEEDRREGRQAVEDFTAMLPEDYRRIYELIGRYLENPSAVSQEAAISKNNVGQLMQDIRQVETSYLKHEEKEEDHWQVLQEISKEMTEHWRENGGDMLPPKKQTVSDVSLIHRSSENRMLSEELEALLKKNRLQRHQEQISEEATLSRQVMNRNVYEQQAQQNVIRQAEDLNELVRQGIRQQLGTLTEQIYTKLEKRLESEKRRRGYS